MSKYAITLNGEEYVVEVRQLPDEETPVEEPIEENTEDDEPEEEENP